MCYVTELRSAWIGGAYKMKRSNKFKLWWRETQMVVRGLTSTKHVVLAHIIPTRKCNLACAYCNEYDDFSPPVPTDEMIRRIDRLAYLKTSIVTISGGAVKPLNRREERVFREIRNYGKHSYSRLNWFQHNLARGIPNDWRCRAGARYLYICEDGLVHYCSQQRGYPAIPLEKYTFAHM